MSNLASAAGNEISLLEFKVGKITKVQQHDTSFVSEVDTGESTGPRIVVSAIAQYVPITSMLNRLVVVLCNLKPREIRGFTSHGMLMCASNFDHSKVGVHSYFHLYDALTSICDLCV